MERALRTTGVSIEFDGQLCVSSPAGDFFGSGYGLNPFHDWFRAVESGGRMSCSWVMPFARSCRIQLKSNRKLARDKFTPARFICPHGACFDHQGNIFIVQRVEIGRVTKLRRLA